MSKKIGAHLSRGHAPDEPKNFSTTLILTQSRNNRQALLARLKRHIRRRELTDSLEILESVGISDDLALFVIGNLQVGVAL